MKQAFQNFFTYQTSKVVIVVDRKIGIVYYTLCAIIFAYIVFYCLLAQESYYDFQFTQGKSSIRAFGSFLGTGSDGTTRVFDSGDVIRDIDQTNGIFIATYIQITPSQVLEYCEITTCTEDTDCVDNAPYADPICLSTGYCQEYSWCPINLDSTSTVAFSVSNITTMTLMYQNVIQFGSDDDKFNVYYTTSESNETIYYPSAGANSITLSKVLSEAGVDISSVMDYGSLLQIDFYYDCVMSQVSCDPTIYFTNLGGGVNQSIWVEDTIQYYIGTELYRDYINYQGVRIIFNVHGKGKEFSYCNVILQVSSLLALLHIAGLLSDMIMLHFPGLPEEHRTMYYKYKIENSEDFSNLQEKLNLINNEQSKKMKKLKRQRQEKDEGFD